MTVKQAHRLGYEVVARTVTEFCLLKKGIICQRLVRRQQFNQIDALLDHDVQLAIKKQEEIEAMFPEFYPPAPKSKK